MFFMRNLDDLNLREQIMLVAAVKKPTRIKEYAQWLKAEELRRLKDNGASKRELEAWERKNDRYQVQRKNYRDILKKKESSRKWLEKRIVQVLKLLMREGEITRTEYDQAVKEQWVSFDFAPGIQTNDPRLANNIMRELDRELGKGRSNSGLVVISTVDMDLQKKLQAIIDRNTRKVDVAGKVCYDGQPSTVLLEGGGRIVKANRIAPDGSLQVVNTIIADVGGPTRVDDEWDWVTQANRSLGSSLKPLLDLYFLLEGYNLYDQLRNSRVTYKTYTLEQRKVLYNYIRKNPDREKKIASIEKYWSWSPRNYRVYTNEWVTVREALIRSVNSIHVQIQEIVSPVNFARLLNETMAISNSGESHKGYRSLILGGSPGDQRYDRFLMAYSIFPNEGILKKHTYFHFLRFPNGSVVRPDYQVQKVGALEMQGIERIASGCRLINLVLREIVTRGTMHAMGDIGAGKTGTSNELRDALATAHFVTRGETYIAGVRLGNRRNFSIGRAADKIAVPVLRSIVTSAFDRENIMTGGKYDSFLRRRVEDSEYIVKRKKRYYLKGNPYKSRRLKVTTIKESQRKAYLLTGNDLFKSRRYEEAASFYEKYLEVTTRFDSTYPAFHNMVTCYMEMDEFNRAAQLIERFSVRGKTWRIKKKYDKEYGVDLKVDTRFYGRDGEISDLIKGKEDKDKKKKKKKDKSRKQELIEYAEKFVNDMGKKEGGAGQTGESLENKGQPKDGDVKKPDTESGKERTAPEGKPAREINVPST
jgi:membrane peptidoglycan carboxypeptidase